MLKLLILVRPFGQMYPKHNAKFEFLESIKQFAEVYFWSEDGDILQILKKIPYKPDFILQYDVTAKHIFSPRITNLDRANIPVGTIVIDAHTKIEQRMNYFDENKIDLIFSASKHPFLTRYSKYKDKFRFLPFSINPDHIKDWKLKKDIDFLLMGLILPNSYPFRNEVLNKMKNVKGFVYHQHPGHLATFTKNLIVAKKYGQEINRSKFFFTCGSIYQYPVMKFFEVPGCKTLLMAEPNQDILDLGFKDGVHFVACNKSDFFDKATYYLKNKNKRKEITNNGYHFIHKYHTHRQRAKEFVQEINNFLSARKS